MPAAFSGAAAPTTSGEWKPAEPKAHWPRGAWWRLFVDTELDRLQARADANNQQLAAAAARFAFASATGPWL